MVVFPCLDHGLALAVDAPGFELPRIIPAFNIGIGQGVDFLLAHLLHYLVHDDEWTTFIVLPRLGNGFDCTSQPIALACSLLCVGEHCRADFVSMRINARCFDGNLSLGVENILSHSLSLFCMTNSHKRDACGLSVFFTCQTTRKARTPSAMLLGTINRLPSH